MCFKLVSFFVLALAQNGFLFEERDANEFSVVSTSERPFDLKLEHRLQEIEKQLEHLKNSINQVHPQQNFPKNCQEVTERGHKVSGIYRIQPELAPEAFLVLCDMDTRGGGWTYVVNRFDGSQEFYLNWEEYKQGFGNLAGEFWLGLEYLHQLTGYEPNEVLIELVDWDLNKVHAHYSVFSIGSEKEGYSLKVLGGYSGDAGDSFRYHAGNKFTTKDKDQDQWTTNCAHERNGGWWYKACLRGQLTGIYKNRIVPSSDKYRIMYWETFHGGNYSLKETRMMVKPRNNRSAVFLPHGKNK